jgi:hypothetical protein
MVGLIAMRNRSDPWHEVAMPVYPVGPSSLIVLATEG